VDDSPFLGDDPVHPPLDLEIDGSLVRCFIVPDAQFVAVAVAVDGFLVGPQIGGIKVQAVNGVGEIGLGGAVGVHVQIRGDEVAYPESNFFVDHILVLKPLFLDGVHDYKKALGVA